MPFGSGESHWAAPCIPPQALQRPTSDEGPSLPLLCPSLRQVWCSYWFFLSADISWMYCEMPRSTKQGCKPPDGEVPVPPPVCLFASCHQVMQLVPLLRRASEPPRVRFSCRQVGVLAPPV